MHTGDSDDRTLRKMAALSFGQGEYEKALVGYLALAERGDVDCQRIVGRMYHEGNGTAKNLEKAKYWYNLACENNDARSQHYMAVVYEQEGKHTTALEWFEKSSRQGYQPAMLRVALYHSRGRGVPVNKAKALILMEEAARTGNVKAKVEYAKLLMRGHKGFINIFRGIYLLISSFIDGLRIASKDIKDERLTY